MYKALLIINMWWYNLNLKSVLKKFFISYIKVVSILALFVFFTTNEYHVDRYYLKDDKGNTVIYQGMVHFANGDYYERMNGFISDKKEEGYIHLYEMVTNAHDGSMSVLNDNIFNLMPDLSKTDLKSQGDHFDMHKEDIRADVNSKQLAEAIGYKYESKPVNMLFDYNQEELTNTLAPFSIAMGLNIADALQNKHFILVDYFTEGDLYYGIIEYRNEVLLQEVVKQIENGNKKIIISYGNAHYDDFFKRLQKHGFYEYKHEKVSAIKNF